MKQDIVLSPLIQELIEDTRDELRGIKTFLMFDFYLRAYDALINKESIYDPEDGIPKDIIRQKLKDRINLYLKSQILTEEEKKNIKEEMDSLQVEDEYY